MMCLLPRCTVQLRFQYLVMSVFLSLFVPLILAPKQPHKLPQNNVGMNINKVISLIEIYGVKHK